MINKTLYILIFLKLLLYSNIIFAQNKTYHCRKAKQIIEFIEQYHFNPSRTDKKFNKEVNSTFVTMLDPVSLFFTEKDTAAIIKSIPDLSNMDCNSYKNFMDNIAGLYKRKLLTADSIILEISKNPLEFNEDEFFIVKEPQLIKYPGDLSGIKENWEKYIRFQILRYFFSGYKSDDSTFIKNKDNFKKNKGELLIYVKQREQCKISHLLDYPSGFENYIFNLYLNTLSGCFDPHTAYFSLNDKEQFQSSLSRNKISFGADLDQNKDGEIYIAHLIPGGPAWRSNELNEGDVLLNIHFHGKESIDLICSNLSEIEEIIYNSGSLKLEITVRNKLGLIKTVGLKLEDLESSENVVYSFILDGESKIGYISLPGFYTEPDKDDPLGCASDLVKEILKLQEDNIQGIILDLRNNGGGSINEAVDLAGIFLDSGPLCLYEMRNEPPSLIKDLKRGSIYDGPLILLVNGYSASASEILAGMLRDHNRAVIVGTSTFGKASGQMILGLGPPGNHSPEYYMFNPSANDFLKITTTKYYRLNGSSHQALGIQPDISFPEFVGYSKVKESAFPSAFKNDTVIKSVTFEPFPELQTDTLNSLSMKRRNKNTNFKQFISLNDSIKPLFEPELKIPLGFNTFKKDFLQKTAHFHKMDSIFATPEVYYKIENNSFNTEILEYDTYRTTIHEEIIKNMTRDFYLEETYLIMNDYINILKVK